MKLKYVYEHSDDDYDMLPNLSDVELCNVYLGAYDWDFESACKSEMTKRFIEHVRRSERLRLQRRNTYFHRIRVWIRKKMR